MAFPLPARLEIDGPVARIILDRPGALNAIDQAMATELAQLGDLVAADDQVRVLVVQGAGRAFCAGGDIRSFAANLDAIDPAIRALLTDYHRFLLALRRMPKLVLTGIHGAAAGAGFSLAFMGDICIAAESARLRPSYASLGVSPDGGGTAGLVDAVGARRAMQIYLGGEELSLAEAQAMGLVAKIVPDAELERETMALAHRIAATDAGAIAATKSLVWRRAEGDLAGQLEMEMELLIGCMGSEAFRQRVRDFVGIDG